MKGQSIGVVRKLVRERGFGFLRCNRTGEEYFLHVSELVGGLRFEELNEGVELSFVPVSGDRGPRAISVQRL